jgi:hypothetical protein
LTERSTAELAARLGRLERHKGELAADTTACRHGLAGALHGVGRLGEAEEQYRLAHRGFVQNFGEQHLLTLSCRANLALVVRDRGRPREALALLEGVHRARTALLGPAHPLTLNAANNLVTTLADAGEAERAAALYPALTTACERGFGPGSAETEGVRASHAALLRRLGRYEEAAALMGTAALHPLPEVLLGCARLLRSTGLVPVALTASRRGAELTLGDHARARQDLARGLGPGDHAHAVVSRVVAPWDLPVPYAPSFDGREVADRVADGCGALAEHLAEAAEAVGAERLRLRVVLHHQHRPKLSAHPVLALDRRAMARADRARHERLLGRHPRLRRLTGVPGAPPPVPWWRADRWWGGGLTVVLPGAPAVAVSTVLGVRGRPAPAGHEV